MLGKKIYKSNFNQDDFANTSFWCMDNDCHIEDKGDYYEVEKNSAYIPSKAEQIIELQCKLNETDYVVIKIAEGVATMEEYAEILSHRAEWRKQINELQQTLEQV